MRNMSQEVKKINKKTTKKKRALLVASVRGKTRGREENNYHISF